MTEVITVSYFQKGVVWAALIVIITTPLAQIPAMIDRNTDPYVGVSAIPATDTVVAGGALVVEYKLERRRLCRTDIERFIRMLPVQDVVWRERVPGGSTPLGKHTVINRIKLSQEIEPGEYQLQTTVSSECVDGFHSTLMPVVNFTVK